MQRPKFSREFKLGAKCPPDISSFPSLSLTVVRTSLLRITPAKLIAYIRRARVSQATFNPSRRSCR